MPVKREKKTPVFTYGRSLISGLIWSRFSRQKMFVKVPPNEPNNNPLWRLAGQYLPYRLWQLAVQSLPYVIHSARLAAITDPDDFCFKKLAKKFPHLTSKRMMLEAHFLKRIGGWTKTHSRAGPAVRNRFSLLMHLASYCLIALSLAINLSR